LGDVHAEWRYSKNDKRGNNHPQEHKNQDSKIDQLKRPKAVDHHLIIERPGQ
jgi:hypothetical protein